MKKQIDPVRNKLGIDSDNKLIINDMLTVILPVQDGHSPGLRHQCCL